MNTKEIQTERRARLKTFLDAHGWGNAALEPLSGDASFRRYVRVRRGEKTAMVMDAPPENEDVRPFVRIARHLFELGFSAPEILGQDAENGFLLLEDLGDDTFTKVLAAQSEPEESLYEHAVDVLIRLHALPEHEAVPEGLPAYNLAALLEEAYLLCDWYYPAVVGEPVTPGAREQYTHIWTSLAPFTEQAGRTLVLRDYHVDNLMWLPERQGVRACGLLDFQDALAGSRAYDLMSLLEDARRDVSADITRRMLTRYQKAFPEMNVSGFKAAYAVLGAQRHAKVIGIFTRLYKRDNKPVYLEHIPRVWRLLERACAHPLLEPLKDWLDLHIPPQTRIIPGGGDKDGEQI